MTPARQFSDIGLCLVEVTISGNGNAVMVPALEQMGEDRPWL
jgi:hypothetical protein